MRTNQKGFTLIELIVVIVILGILAATALPKFVNLTDDANLAKAKGVAGAVAGSATVQYSAWKIGKSGYSYDPVLACSGSYLQGDAMPSGCTGAGGTSCTVTCDGQTTPDAVTLPASS